MFLPYLRFGSQNASSKVAKATNSWRDLMVSASAPPSRTPGSLRYPGSTSRTRPPCRPASRTQTPPEQQAFFHSVVLLPYLSQRPPHTPAWFPERQWNFPAELLRVVSLKGLASTPPRFGRNHSHVEGLLHNRDSLHHRAGRALRELRPREGTPPEWQPGRVGRQRQRDASRFPPAVVTEVLLSNAQANAV